MEHKLPVKPRKKYLIALEESRSIVAFFAGVAIFFITLGAVFYMIDTTPETGEPALHYFTVLSNLFSATGAAFMIPYAVEGVRKKRFVLPRWIVVFQYAGTTNVVLTMIISLAFILPTQGARAMSGANFWLHLITPACTFLLFRCVETGIAFTRRDLIFSLVPLCLYTFVYFIMVIVIGKDRGGWSDFYMTGVFWPTWVSALIVLSVGSGISAVLLLFQKRRAAKNRQRIARAWSEDLEPTQLLIEAFGLGRYIGAHCSVEELTVPLDIFSMMQHKYGVPV